MYVHEKSTRIYEYEYGICTSKLRVLHARRELANYRRRNSPPKSCCSAELVEREANEELPRAEDEAEEEEEEAARAEEADGSPICKGERRSE